MNRKIYREVAKKHGVSVKEVKRGINEAIDHTYTIPYSGIQDIKFAGEKPTPDELIAHIAGEAKERAKV